MEHLVAEATQLMKQAGYPEYCEEFLSKVPGAKNQVASDHISNLESLLE